MQPQTFARTVRAAMHEGCECIGENQSVLEAAKRMEQLDIGAMPDLRARRPPEGHDHRPRSS
jgi:hypothetical protein